MSNLQPTPRRDLTWTRGPIQYGVLAIVMLLGLGIAIAGVTRIREENARTQSSNNLRQIGLATHNINDSYKELPLVSGPWKGWSDQKERSLFTCLMPYIIERDRVDEHLLHRLYRDSPFWFVETYVSPADPTGNGTQGECSYAANWQFFQQPPGEPQTYASIPRSMPDGTTNTILFAEIYQNCNGTVRRWGQTGGADVLTTAAFNRMDPPSPKVLNPANGLPQLSPSSDACSPSLAQTPHRRGMLVVLGDASVRSLPLNLPLDTWQRACAPDDQEAHQGGFKGW